MRDYVNTKALSAVKNAFCLCLWSSFCYSVRIQSYLLTPKLGHLVLSYNLEKVFSFQQVIQYLFITLLIIFQQRLLLCLDRMKMIQFI